MLSIKQLWKSNIPYGNERISYTKEIAFVKKHGPILLAGVGAVLLHNIKWGRRVFNIGMWAITKESPGPITREEPKRLPPPINPSSI